MSTVPLARGLNWKTVLLYENRRVEIYNETMDVEELGEEHQDHINGTDSAEFDKTIDGYKITLSNLIRGAEELIMFLDWAKVRQTNTRRPTLGIGLQFGPNNGSKHTFEGSDMTLGLWKLSIGGRKTTTKTSYPLYMKKFRKLG